MQRYRRHPDLSDEELGILIQLASELRLRGYAQKTQKSYMGYCRRFLQWKRDYRRERQFEVRSHLKWLVVERSVSRSAFNIAYSALSFLYGEVLKQPAPLEGLRRPRGGRQLPEILSQREVLRLLDSLRNAKHRELLGHKSSKTTEIYTHVTRKDLVRIESPLDTLLGSASRSD